MDRWRRGPRRRASFSVRLGDFQFIIDKQTLCWTVNSVEERIISRRRSFATGKYGSSGRELSIVPRFDIALQVSAWSGQAEAITAHASAPPAQICRGTRALEIVRPRPNHRHRSSLAAREARPRISRENDHRFFAGREKNVISTSSAGVMDTEIASGHRWI